MQACVCLLPVVGEGKTKPKSFKRSSLHVGRELLCSQILGLPSLSMLLELVGTDFSE